MWWKVISTFFVSRINKSNKIKKYQSKILKIENKSFGAIISSNNDNRNYNNRNKINQMRVT